MDLLCQSYHISLNKVPEKIVLDADVSISLLSNYFFFQQVKNHVSYSCISSNVKIATAISDVICSGCIMYLVFKLEFMVIVKLINITHLNFCKNIINAG